MLPWKTIIKIQKALDVPVYLQVVNAVISEIRQGIIRPGIKMPGTRTMAETLGINRQTVVKVYEELYAQGWIVLIPSKGTFVNEHLPEISPRKLTAEQRQPAHADKTGYSFKINSVVHAPNKPNRNITGFHDGPDVRLVPAHLLARGFKSVLNRKSGLLLLSYVSPEGNQNVRRAISDYLNSSRGLQTTHENIMITRGTQMAMFLTGMALVAKDDFVITASVGYRYADLTLLNAGAKLLNVKVDDEGIDVDEIESICRKKKIRVVYVTSHHHYPTTVTLSAARRMKLLQLAEQYRFIIIEDDYDYEFHYESSPILPLASADRHGMVVYIGSFSKTLSPGIRVGYISAPPNLVRELSKIRQIVDAQGDPILEQVVAELLEEGEIKRHMKKAVKIYHERRNFMAEQLRERAGDVIDFKVPDGGLSFWTTFDKKISVPQLSDQLIKKEVVLSKGLLHDLSAGKKLNSTRMGFAWMNSREAEKAVDVLVKTIKK